MPKTGFVSLETYHLGKRLPTKKTAGLSFVKIQKDQNECLWPFCNVILWGYL